MQALDFALRPNGLFIYTATLQRTPRTVVIAACLAEILQDLLVMVSSRVSFRADVMRTGIGKLPCQSPFSCSEANPFQLKRAPWLPDSSRTYIN